MVCPHSNAVYTSIKLKLEPRLELKTSCMPHYWWQMAVELRAYDERTEHQKISSIKKKLTFPRISHEEVTTDLILQVVLHLLLLHQLERDEQPLSSLGCMQAITS